MYNTRTRNTSASLKGSDAAVKGFPKGKHVKNLSNFPAGQFERVVASRSDFEREDRTLIVKSAATLHMMGQNELTSDETDTTSGDTPPFHSCAQPNSSHDQNQNESTAGESSNSIIVTQKTTSLTYTVASSVDSTFPLSVVITVGSTDLPSFVTD